MYVCVEEKGNKVTKRNETKPFCVEMGNMMTLL